MGFKVYNYLFVFCALLSCATSPQTKTAGIIQLKTVFYDSSSLPALTDFKKVWHRDSCSIEKVERADFVTANSKTTVSYSTLFFRFIDLRQKVFYDYRHFSDTSIPFNKELLPDSTMKGLGWSYYTDKVRRIQGTPQTLIDTIIGKVIFKKIRFNFFGDNLQERYKIGYLRCDGKGELFSLEKSYSKKLNCAMTKFEDFEIGKLKPSVTVEIDFLADSLGANEIKVFDAWEKNIKKYPVANKN